MVKSALLDLGVERELRGQRTYSALVQSPHRVVVFAQARICLYVHAGYGDFVLFSEVDPVGACAGVGVCVVCGMNGKLNGEGK